MFSKNCLLSCVSMCVCSVMPIIIVYKIYVDINMNIIMIIKAYSINPVFLNGPDIALMIDKCIVDSFARMHLV